MSEFWEGFAAGFVAGVCTLAMVTASIIWWISRD